MRADQKTSGQGIGLSIVNEIVSLYGAQMNIDQSHLGGVIFTLRFRR
jgi:signal transduction histidine kinase